MQRTVVGIALGWVISVGLALIVMSTADAAWPSRFARTPAHFSWYLWLLLGVAVHFGGGYAGGRAMRRVMTTPARRERWMLIILVVVVGMVQMIGDWGHPLRFWMQMGMLVAAALGVMWGSRGTSARELATSSTLA